MNEKLEKADNTLHIPIKKGDEIHNDSHYKVNKHLNEVFSVLKSDARVNPGTMMIKIQNTHITSRAMMSSIRFVSFANHTVCFPLAHWGASLKPIVLWYLSRVCC